MHIFIYIIRIPMAYKQTSIAFSFFTLVVGLQQSPKVTLESFVDQLSNPGKPGKWLSK